MNEKDMLEIMAVDKKLGTLVSMINSDSIFCEVTIESYKELDEEFAKLNEFLKTDMPVWQYK